MEDALERAYEAGDHREARRLARRLVSESGDAIPVERARFVLAATAADPFLAWVGLLGLGLSVWLVYNYVL